MIASHARAKGIEVFSSPPSVEALPGLPPDEEDTTRVAIVIGGDGTILRGMHYYTPRGVAVLGLNTGRMGFLAEAEAEGYGDVIDRLASGRYQIDERPVLSLDYPGDGPRLAVNDVCINRSLSGGMLHLGLSVDGQPVARVPGDGIVVSTPMGSTAYALSANGPILDPHLPAMLIAAICPHLITIRPLVVPSTSVIELGVLECRGHPAHVVVDGIPASTVDQDQRLSVSTSERKCRSVSMRSGGYFYRLLGSKFGWGHRGG